MEETLRRRKDEHTLWPERRTPPRGAMTRSLARGRRRTNPGQVHRYRTEREQHEPNCSPGDLRPRAPPVRQAGPESLSQCRARPSYSQLLEGWRYQATKELAAPAEHRPFGGKESDAAVFGRMSEEPETRQTRREAVGGRRARDARGGCESTHHKELPALPRPVDPDALADKEKVSLGLFVAPVPRHRRKCLHRTRMTKSEFRTAVRIVGSPLPTAVEADRSAAPLAEVETPQELDWRVRA